MGVSIRAYGRHRGVSDTAVCKAIKAGRITAEPDGTINPKKDDGEWSRNTDVGQQRGEQQQKAVPRAALDAVSETLREQGTHAGGTTCMQARAANVFRITRKERDSWVSWPMRVSATMAADLGVDAHALHVALEHHLREHLAELAELKLRVD